MSVHTRLVKISAPVDDSSELRKILNAAENARTPELVSSVLLQPIAPVLNPLIFNPMTTRTLENLDVGEASQSMGQNFLGSLGSLGAGVAGGVLGTPLGPVGSGAGLLAGILLSEFHRSKKLKDRVRDAYAAKQLVA